MPPAPGPSALVGGIPRRSLEELLALGYPLRQFDSTTSWGKMPVLFGPPSLLRVIEDVRFNICADLVDHVRTHFPPARAQLRAVSSD